MLFQYLHSNLEVGRGSFSIMRLATEWVESQTSSGITGTIQTTASTTLI